MSKKEIGNPPKGNGLPPKLSRQDVLGRGELLDCDVVNGQIKYLQGKVLTIVEASIGDARQLKAVKDLINVAFSDRLMYVMQLCYPDTQMLTGDQAEALGVLEMQGIVEKQ